MQALFLCVIGVIAMASATSYFKETFDDSWESRWVVANTKQSSGEAGKWEVSAGEIYGDAEADKGLRTTQDARFYFISSKIEPEFSNEGKDLVVQFSVKHEQNIDCGGGYIKLFPAGIDQKTLDGDSTYNIMFGPDICGNTKKVHVIFNYNGENLLTNQEIRCETDTLTHVYTLIVRPDNTYEVRIDGESKMSGDLAEHWDFLEPKTINDPKVSKPNDWVDETMIDDPDDVKPEGYDDIEAMIPDPEAKLPEDWDEEDDGEWDAPMVPNPEYTGPWAPKKIPNPDYIGQWEHPQVPNPKFVDDEFLYRFTSNAMVGFDLWQVKSGTIFDNIIITDSVSEAEDFMKETSNQAAEKKAHEEAKVASERAASAQAEEEDDYDDEEDDYHDEL